MTKGQLINYLAARTGITNADAEVFLNATIDGLMLGLLNDGKVNLTPLGRLEVMTKKGRTFRSAMMDRMVTVPDKRVACLVAAEDFEKKLN